MSFLRDSKGYVSVSHLVLVAAIALATLGASERLGVSLGSTIAATSHARAASHAKNVAPTRPAIGSSRHASTGSAARVLLDAAQTAKELKNPAAQITTELPDSTLGTNPGEFRVVLESEEKGLLNAIHTRKLTGRYSGSEDLRNRHFSVMHVDSPLGRLAAVSSFFHMTNFLNTIEELMGVTIDPLRRAPVTIRPVSGGLRAYYWPGDPFINGSTHFRFGKVPRPDSSQGVRTAIEMPPGAEALPDDGFVRLGSGLMIPTHEASHYYLHTLVGDWYGSSPGSRAFREFLGDFSAMFMATQDADYRAAVLAETGGDLRKDSALSRFGVGFSVGAGKGPVGLRNALNSLSMSDVRSWHDRPHLFSRPVTGAVYDAFVAAYDSLRRDYQNHADPNVQSVANELAMINAGRLSYWALDTALRGLIGRVRGHVSSLAVFYGMANVAKDPANGFGEAGKALASELLESAKRRGIIEE